MNKIYQKPSLRIIDLNTEGNILETSNIPVDPDTVIPDPSTNKKDQNLWGNENIWK